MKGITRLSSISQLHRILGYDKPKHPMISIIDSAKADYSTGILGKKFVLDFYIISIKKHSGKFRYGRNFYDFEEGSMVFTSPGQALTVAQNINEIDNGGWSLYFHPDLLRNSILSEKMRDYTFFHYSATEALHLSEEEKNIMTDCVVKIEKEYNQNLDEHTHNLIISNIELLLNYCSRFYGRQFITRKHQNKDLISKLERYLIDYFSANSLSENGIPTVKQCADILNLTPNYLSDLLKKETGKSTQEHIHNFVIEQAKNKLLSTTLSISEIAYKHGFENPAYFSKIFKSKTGMTPSVYRKMN